MLHAQDSCRSTFRECWPRSFERRSCWQRRIQIRQRPHRQGAKRTRVRSIHVHHAAAKNRVWVSSENHTARESEPASRFSPPWGKRAFYRVRDADSAERSVSAPLGSRWGRFALVLRQMWPSTCLKGALNFTQPRLEAGLRERRDEIAKIREHPFRRTLRQMQRSSGYCRHVEFEHSREWVHRLRLRPSSPSSPSSPQTGC